MEFFAKEIKNSPQILREESSAFHSPNDAKDVGL
jgi:hypothetical protein